MRLGRDFYHRQSVFDDGALPIRSEEMVHDGLCGLVLQQCHRQI